MSTAKLDPVKYEILYNRLEQEMFEAKEVVRHLSASTIVREAGEVAEVICVQDGTACLISAGLLVHVASVTRNIKFMVADKYGDDIGISDGDQFIGNDCHIGGMHIPDMMLIAPFFYKGQHIGWLGNYTHVPEVGAIEPGGMCASAREFCHEGIRLPGVKIVEKGRVKRDIMKILTHATRDPKTIEIDTRAKIAGNERARKRLTKVIDEVGLDFYLQATQQMVEDAEKFARDKIKSLRPGKYRARIYTDSVGTFEQKLRTGELCMEIREDGQMVLSAPVASPQALGFNNCALPAIEGLLFCVLLWQFFYKARWNTGMLNAITLELPDHSMFNVDRRAAVGYCPIGVGMQFQGALNEVISRASFPVGNYEDMIGPCSHLNCPTIGGLDRYGRTYGAIVTSEMGCGGGALHQRDGHDSSVTQFNPWTDCGDIETEEVGPVLMFTRRQRPDSGGLGKFRGGVACQSIYTPHASPVTFFGLSGSGGYVSEVQGMYGGYPTPACTLDIVYDSDIFDRGKRKEPLPHSIDELDLVGGKREKVYPSAASRQLKPGDLYCVQYWGGGGSGDPLERDPDLIVQDFQNNLTTLRTIETVYGVKINPNTLDVDEKKTTEMRNARRKERLKQGTPGLDYVRRMVETRKNRDLPAPVLRFYDEMLEFCEGFRKEIALEESFAAADAKTPEKPLNSSNGMPITPYVKIVEGEKGGNVAVCAECGHAFCDASENFKLYCLIYDRDPAEIYPGDWAPDRNWMVFREFYCPGCGTQVEVEGTGIGTPIVHSVELKL